MATEEDVPLAQAVSAAFIEQYFLILQKRPEEARRLYVDASVVSRPGPDGVMMSFTSVEAINEQYLSYDYENTTFEVLSVDSQSSYENGIVIVVIGFSTGKDNLRRKFCQMFYLARQENNVHVVVNDIFRYVDEEAFTTTTLPVFESVPATEIADVINKTEPIREIDASLENSVNDDQVKKVAEVKDAVAGAIPPLDNGNIKHSEKSVTAPKPTEPVAETVAPQPDGAKRSFAAIVQSMAKNQAPFQVKASVQKPKQMVQSRAAAATQAPASFSKSEKKFDQKIIEEPGTSIFVANLPMNAMPPQVHELFKDFGPIKENGVQVRSTRATATCYGFVAFESAASVQSVLQAARNNPFVLADRKLRVKEKEVDYDGSKPSSVKSGGGSKPQNGSADGGDEFKPRPNRNRRNGGKRDSNPKNSEGGAPQVQA